MIERLPARVRTPSVARAVVSPSAILLAGAGAAAAIAGGLPLAAAAVAGGLAWAVRVALAIPRTPAEDRIDPYTIGEPWRRFVEDALQARRQFENVVRRTPDGPLRDRLGDIGRRIAEGVSECWRIACRGDALQGALKQLDVEEIHKEMASLDEDRRTRGLSDDRRQALDRTYAAVAAQLAAAERIGAVYRNAYDRLRVLNAQLDEAVARAVELSVGAHDASALNPLAGDVENLVSELENLRQALEETEPGTSATTG